jgi:hypothetical protein
MKFRFSVAGFGLLALTLTGCAGLPGVRMPTAGMGSRGAADARPQMPDRNAIMAKTQLMQDLMNNPDLPSWHEQRQKQTLAVGDRVFDKSFDQVFDGMVVALATLGARVNNMDRTSGYITASIPDLGPERTQQLHREALSEYAQAKGYPPSVLQKQGPYDNMDVTLGQNMMGRMGGSGLTLTMVRQGPKQTKVKLRFDNVYFPKTSQELYRSVWVAVDKQMFLDKGLD